LINYQHESSTVHNLQVYPGR